jgi:hypothetical protein
MWRNPDDRNIQRQHLKQQQEDIRESLSARLKFANPVTSYMRQSRGYEDYLTTRRIKWSHSKPSTESPILVSHHEPALGKK